MSKPGVSLYVNADWSALVPAGSPAAAFGIAPEDAKRRGLLPLEEGEHFAQPEFLHSANVEPAEPEPESEDAVEADPEPDAKEAPTPANKAAKKPANKGKDA